MNVKLNLFPGGLAKALTLSYDDGRDHDRRQVEIMNRYGIRGSFHLNSGFFGRERYITAEEVATLFRGHEVSAHTSTHPFLEMTPREGVATQLLEDRAKLEALCGYPVRGMSYPFGTYNQEVLAALPALGIEYSRTTRSHGGFHLPENWLEWHPTCHHRDMLKTGEDFLNLEQRHPRMLLFYLWGHSYEFENNNNWEELEQFCAMMGNRQEIWYATNIEIVDYIRAVKSLRFSVSQTIVYNPTATDVWISVDGAPVKITAGQQIRLGE
ncbi:MAG: polysaccharide deacetylase [Paenibacillaceae bacterium]|jgi:peptidoglycan/xylan/chitin deacetylase (PgdA/CDA1 family)|nr:polysaccharide deacetylase [Paenibacillaceae bacterium]